MVERQTLKFQYCIEIRYISDLPKLTTAASLAYHQLLRSVNYMELCNVDLASVPTEHLASLAGCVTGRVEIENIRNCDLIHIMDSLRCVALEISSQIVSSEETWALVRAMETGVEEVMLGFSGEVSLDIRALTQYSRQGECSQVMFCYKTADKYREEVTSWTQRINCFVFNDTRYSIKIYIH